MASALFAAEGRRELSAPLFLAPAFVVLLLNRRDLVRLERRLSLVLFVELSSSEEVVLSVAMLPEVPGFDTSWVFRLMDFLSSFFFDIQDSLT